MYFLLLEKKRRRKKKSFEPLKIKLINNIENKQYISTNTFSKINPIRLSIEREMQQVEETILP